MKKIICFLLMTILLLSACGGVVCNSAGNNMYNAYLSALNKGFIYYSLYDIDKNGVTELIVYDGGEGLGIPSYSYDLTVYTMKNNKLAYVGELNTKDYIYGSAEKGIWTWFNNGSAGNENYDHYLLNNGKLTSGNKSFYFNYTGNPGSDPYDYYINNKKVNKAQYEQMKNSMFKIEKYDDKAVLDILKDNKGQIGEVINHTVYTDIVAKINGCDIPSYNINGYTAVAAEDLRDYGFEVIWDGNARTLSVLRNFEKLQVTSHYEAPEISYGMVGKRAYNVLRTDIQTYVNGNLVTGHNIDGKTIIYFNDLAVFGGVSYDNDKRILSLEMEGLSGGDYKTYLTKRNSITVKTWDENAKGRESSEAVGFVAAYLNGKELWKYKTPVTPRAGAVDIISNAFRDGDTVYFGTADGFFAVDLYTGTQKWKIDVLAVNIYPLIIEGDTIHGVFMFDAGIKYMAIDKNGNIIRALKYVDTDGSWAEVPNLKSVSGNIVTFHWDSNYNIWQQINIKSK